MSEEEQRKVDEAMNRIQEKIESMIRKGASPEFVRRLMGRVLETDYRYDMVHPSVKANAEIIIEWCIMRALNALKRLIFPSEEV